MSARFAELWQRARGVAPTTVAPPPDEIEPSNKLPPESHRVAPRVDGMAISGSSYRARLASLGIETPATVANFCTENPPRRRFEPEVEAALGEAEQVRLDAESRRAAELDASAIAGRSAAPDEVRERLRRLGLADAAESLRLEPAQPAEEPSSAPVGRPEDVRRKRLDLAEAVVEALIVGGHRIDARRLSADEVAVFMRRRGVTG